MTQQRIITVLPSAARTVTGTADLGASVNEFDSLDLFIDVTAVSGTAPTLVFTYQASVDGGVTFYDITSGASITAANKQAINVPNRLGSVGRLSFVIGGTTPSYTFSVIAQYRRVAN